MQLLDHTVEKRGLLGSPSHGYQDDIVADLTAVVDLDGDHVRISRKVDLSGLIVQHRTLGGILKRDLLGLGGHSAHNNNHGPKDGVFAEVEAAVGIEGDHASRFRSFP